jgi:hypothetical protein
MVNERTYYLDLPTLLTLLRNKKGTLTTRIKLSEYKTTGTGTVAFAFGRITACTLEWSKGHLEGEEAYKRLQTIQEWNVHFETQQPANPFMQQAAYTTNVTPEYSQAQPPIQAAASGSLADLPPISDVHRNPLTGTAVPKPFQLLTEAELAAFNSAQRTILQAIVALVDGYRSIAAIQAQLPYPAETIMQALEVLLSMNKIIY